MDSGPLASGLYLVSTPIGNLEDITLRALRVLKSAQRIACEDTRHTGKLLAHFDIATPMVSYHQHNEGLRANELLEQMRAGAAIALVSDAGTPGIRDPGEELVRAAIVAGVAVYAVPGASALLAALVPSGLPMDDFRFAGFLPSRSGERRTLLESLRTDAATLVFYETPHRVMESLEDLEQIFGGARQIVLARELTKVHEEFVRGTIAEVRSELLQRPSVRGEMVIMTAGFDASLESSDEGSDETLLSAMARLMGEGRSEKDALKALAKSRGANRDELYREWQRTKPRAGGK